MKFNNEQLSQLNSALSTLNPDYISLIKNLLIQLIETDSWLANAVLTVLNNGIKFRNANIDHIGRYYVESNTIVINPLILSVYNKIPEIKYLLGIVIRHELTHAFDLVGSSHLGFKQFVLSKTASRNILYASLILQIH